MSGWNGTPFSGVGRRLGHDGEDEEKPKDTEIQTVDSDDEPNDVGDCPIFVILDSVLAKNGKLEEVCTVASSWLLRVPEHSYTSGIRKNIETLIDTTKTHIAHIEKFVNDLSLLACRSTTPTRRNTLTFSMKSCRRSAI